MLFVAAMLHAGTARGEIPLPNEAMVSGSSRLLPPSLVPMAGVWGRDAWYDVRPAAVAIGSDEGHTARVTQAYDADPWRPMSASSHTGAGHWDGDTLVAPFSDHLAVRYRLLPDGRLFGRLERRAPWNGVRYVVFERLPADRAALVEALARPDRRAWHLVDIPMTDPDSGQRITLKASYYPPAVTGRVPLLLMTHGDVRPGREDLVLRQGELARLFVSRGWSVLEVMRRGTGGSGGTLLPEFRSDGPPSAAYGDRRMLADIADFDAVVAHVRTWPGVDPARILLGGFSRGGLVALEYLAVRPDAAAGAINFAGSIWCEDIERAHVQGRYTGERFGAAGARSRKPTWWFYADNDHCQSAALTRQRFEGYRAAGGTGELHVYSGLRRDGHDLIDWPVLWEADLLTILRRLSP